MYFNITSDMLRMLINFRTSISGWNQFLTEFNKIRDDNRDCVIHFNPGPADINARDRYNVMRGITICLDVLSNSFNDPESLLEDVVIAEKEAENLLRENQADHF